MPNSELTIISVCQKKHYDYIRQQVELIDRLNPKMNWNMIVIDNTQIDEVGLSIRDPRCRVLPGVPVDYSKPENCRGSYHHAAALNKALAEVKTQFLLVLDPDLFVIYHNWIGESIQHMRHNNLGFFGIPWHPRWYNKYRYFPCVHFLMIDLGQVKIESIDFTPTLMEAPPLFYRVDWLIKQKMQKKELKAVPLHCVVDAVGPKKAVIWSILYAIYRAFPLLFSRYRIHSSRDTGWKLWNNFGRNKRYHSDIVQPVVDFPTQLIKPVHLQTNWGKRLERMFPRRWSFLPAEGTYVIPKQAPGFDLAELRTLNAETFVWRGAPFAFHLRRYLWDTVMGGRNAMQEKEILETLFECVTKEPCWFLWAKRLKQSTCYRSAIN